MESEKIITKLTAVISQQSAAGKIYQEIQPAAHCRLIADK
jgi:hypothetical protein